MSYFKGISICLLSFSFILNAHSQTLPKTPQKEHELKFHDTIVNDPYAWLERTDKGKVEKWYQEQTDYANEQIRSIPQRELILNSLNKIMEDSPEDVTDITYRSGTYFYYKQEADDNQRKLYYREGLDGEEKLIFDPESINADGKIYSLITYSVSFDEKYLTLSLAPDGSELPELFIYDMEKGALLGEKLDFAYAYAMRWLNSNLGFTYLRYSKVNPENRQEAFRTAEVYYHEIGTPFESDKLIISKDQYPELDNYALFRPVISHPFESPYMILYQSNGLQKGLVVYFALQKDLFSDHIEWTKIANLNDEIRFFYTIGSDFFAIQSKNTTNNRFVKVDLTNPQQGFREVIPETDEELVSVAPKDGGLYAVYKNGPYSRLFWLPENDAEKRVKVELPFNGSCSWTAYYDMDDRLLFSLESYARQKRFYIHDAAENKIIETNLLPVSQDFGDIDIKTELVFATAKDGTAIPITLIYQKNLKLDGTNPLLITAYGAYGKTVEAKFVSTYQLISDMNAVYAIAHVRGGGFYGDAWHEAGILDKKPNTWNDLISCTEYLIEQGYTVPEKTVALGGSAGGIAVGRAMTERPDLFAAVISQVGYSNTANFYESSAEVDEIPEFGDIKDPDQFRAKFEMDSYFHVKNGVDYPAVLLTAGWNDRRVPAWQAGKMTAMLQNCTASEKPVILMVDFKGGHLGATTKAKMMDNYADAVTFFLWQTDCLDRVD